MSIDINGGMIVGAYGEDINLPEDFDNMWDYAEKNNLSYFSPQYDADDPDCFYGFEVKDVDVCDIENGWVEEVKQLAVRFEELTGTKAKLVGMQDIYQKR